VVQHLVNILVHITGTDHQQERLAGVRRVCGRERRTVHAVGHHMDAFGRVAIGERDVLARGFGHRENGPAAPQQTRQPEPEVQVLRPVLARKAQADQVVNRDDLSLGARQAMVRGRVDQPPRADVHAAHPELPSNRGPGPGADGRRCGRLGQDRRLARLVLPCNDLQVEGPQQGVCAVPRVDTQAGRAGAEHREVGDQLFRHGALS